MAAATRKANAPATHPTVWAGLALAAVGLLIAAFAYTGTRVYDVLYAFVALVGALFAFLGILTAAWGRSIMASRASRARRGLDDNRRAAQDAAVAVSETPPPTVAAPAEKKRFKFPMPQRREKPATQAAGAGGVFAFRRREAAPATPAVEPAPEPVQEAPAAEPAAPPVVERVTLKCPQCATQFTTEGVRPMPATCPSCGFSATV